MIELIIKIVFCDLLKPVTKTAFVIAIIKKIIQEKFTGKFLFRTRLRVIKTTINMPFFRFF